jgi:hypothetical protein
MSEIRPPDVNIEPQKSEVKPLQLSDEEWSHEKIIDELLCDLASVEQSASNEGGEIVIIRKYQSLCRRLGGYIPVAQPTSDYVIYLSDLKPEVKGALEKIRHLELRRLLAHQAVLRLFEAVGIDPYISIGRKLVIKVEGDQNPFA